MISTRGIADSERCRRKIVRYYRIWERARRFLQFDAGTEFYDAVSRDIEETGGARRIARHDGKYFLAPQGHILSHFRNERLAGNKKGCFHHFEFETVRLAQFERRRHVGIVLESVVHDGAIKVVIKNH